MAVQYLSCSRVIVGLRAPFSAVGGVTDAGAAFVAEVMIWGTLGATIGATTGAARAAFGTGSSALTPLER